MNSSYSSKPKILKYHKPVKEQTFAATALLSYPCYEKLKPTYCQEYKATGKMGIRPWNTYIGRETPTSTSSFLKIINHQGEPFLRKQDSAMINKVGFSVMMRDIGPVPRLNRRRSHTSNRNYGKAHPHECVNRAVRFNGS